MKVKTFWLSLFLIFFFCCPVSYARQGYYEKVTADGKIISGLSQEEVLNKYGLPLSVNNKLWYYGGPERVYVYLENALGVYLYPRFCNTSVGTPLELKILAGSDQVIDVTSQAQLLLDQPDDFSIAGQGVVVPKKPGRYQIVALYKDSYSNTSFVSVNPSEEKSQEEVLISLDVLPYKSYTGLKTKINLLAFGTFAFKDKYSIREVTSEAEWFMQQNNKNQKLENPYVEMSMPAKLKVFCKYRGMQSLFQDVEIVGNPVLRSRYLLRQITIVPAYVSVAAQATIPLLAFATYEDNGVEDVTKSADWEILDKTILKKEPGNNFVAESIGIGRIQATLSGLKSLPAKVAVSLETNYKVKSQEKIKKKESAENLLKNIKNDLANLKNKITTEEKFKSIKIVPPYCDIPAGEEKQLLAIGVRPNNTEEDITLLGQWESLDKNIATVSNGLVKAVYIGETRACFRYKEMKNECAKVVVQEPKLISITVSPVNLKIITGERSDLKAEGLFGDSTRKDITLLANWVSDNLKIASINKGKVKALRAGQTKIHAGYLGVAGGPVNLEVVKEKYWLLKIIIKIIASLLLLMLIIYAYFYIITEQIKSRILNLYAQPKDFIMALHSNLNKVMVVFGVEYKFYMPPLLFAALADKHYALKENLFFRFAQRFEEAKYSSHVFSLEASRVALNDYNQILGLVLVQNKKMAGMFNYLKALLNKAPLFINIK